MWVFVDDDSDSESEWESPRQLFDIQILGGSERWMDALQCVLASGLSGAYNVILLGALHGPAD